MTELQKGKIALNFMKMNSSPVKWNYYKRFINNKGDVRVDGYHPLTGKKGQFAFSGRASADSSPANHPAEKKKVVFPKISKPLNASKEALRETRRKTLEKKKSTKELNQLMATVRKQMQVAMANLLRASKGGSPARKA